MLNSCVYHYFSYGIIFVVFLWSCVGVGNFICGSIDYATSPDEPSIETIITYLKNNYLITLFRAMKSEYGAPLFIRVGPVKRPSQQPLPTVRSE